MCSYTTCNRIIRSRK